MKYLVTFLFLLAAATVPAATDASVATSPGVSASGAGAGLSMGLPPAGLQSVTSVAALKALDVSTLANGGGATVLGYRTAGDGGGGVFIYEAASAATTYAGIVEAPKVGPGRWIRSITGPVNVRWAGAVGDGSTDDAPAIQAAIDFAASWPAADELTQRSVVYFPPAKYYLTKSTINVPAQVGLEMEGTIRFAPARQTIPCLVIGATGHTNRCSQYNLSVTGNAVGDWSNLNYVGIRLVNANDCQVMVRRCANFTVGLELLGDDDGVQYNTFTLGDFINNRYGVYLRAVNAGWVNENLYLNGNFTVTNSYAYYATDRAALWLTTGDNNVFIKPSFQIGKSSGGTRGYPIICTDGVNNTFANCRFEGVDYVMHLTGGSYNNTLTVGFTGGLDIPAAIVDEATSRGSTIVTSVHNLFGYNLVNAVAFTARNSFTLGGSGSGQSFNYAKQFKSYALTGANMVLGEATDVRNTSSIFDLKSDSTLRAPAVGIRFLAQAASGPGRNWGLITNNTTGGDFEIVHSPSAAAAPTTVVASFSDAGDYTLARGGLSIEGAGKTVSVKSGANALAGTVTLSRGKGTITSTAIDANTVIVLSLKMNRGTPGAYQPQTAVARGRATVTGAATDDSTYNWVALKVN